MDKPKVPSRGKRNLAPMPTTPGDYLSGGDTRDSYAKSMSKESRQKDVTSGALITPRTYGGKTLAKKTGGFKGFKI